MSRPRLAYLFSRFPYFSQTFCDTEMLGLEDRGWDVVAASCYPPENSFRHERLDDLSAPLLFPPPAQTLKLVAERARRDGRWPKRLVDQHDMGYGKGFRSEVRARNALWLARALKREGVEHIHVHFANRATHTALFIREIAQIPFSFTAHAQDFMVDLGSRELLGEMVAKARFVVAVSDYTTDILREWYPDYAGKIHRVYNGLDTAEFLPATVRPKGWPVRIFSVGRLIEFKGFHHLLTATARANEEGAQIELRIAGEGPWEERLHAQAEELNLGDQVTFLGRLTQHQILTELQAAQVFALASLVDSKGASDILPTVITEAMLCGLPVISTHLAGIPEMVVDGETGILCPPGDVNALSAALIRMASNPARLVRNGEAGRARALALFDRENTLSQLEQLFESHHHAEDRGSGRIEPGLFVFLETPAPPGTRLACELEALARGLPNARLIAARLGSEVDSEGLDRQAELIERLDWLPDGVVLEMEWSRAGAHRHEIETLRTRLGSQVEGEAFFRAARRAFWSAHQIHRRYRDPAERRQIHLHSLRSDTLLWTWLTSLLAGVPFTACVEHGPVLGYSLIREIARDALTIWAERPDKAGESSFGHASWPLHDPEPERKRVGPVSWKTHTEEARPEESQDLVDALAGLPAKLRSFTRRPDADLQLVRRLTGQSVRSQPTATEPEAEAEAPTNPTGGEPLEPSPEELVEAGPLKEYPPHGIDSMEQLPPAAAATEPELHADEPYEDEYQPAEEPLSAEENSEARDSANWYEADTPAAANPSEDDTAATSEAFDPVPESFEEDFEEELAPDPEASATATEPTDAVAAWSEPTPVEPIPVEPSPWVDPDPVEFAPPIEPAPEDQAVDQLLDDAVPVESTPTEPTPDEAIEIEPTTAKPTLIEPPPVHPIDVEPAIDETIPVEPTLIEPTPAEATQVEPEPETGPDASTETGLAHAPPPRRPFTPKLPPTRPHDSVPAPKPNFGEEHEPFLDAEQTRPGDSS